VDVKDGERKKRKKKDKNKEKSEKSNRRKRKLDEDREAVVNKNIKRIRKETTTTARTTATTDSLLSNHHHHVGHLQKDDGDSDYEDVPEDDAVASAEPAPRIKSRIVVVIAKRKRRRKRRNRVSVHRFIVRRWTPIIKAFMLNEWRELRCDYKKTQRENFGTIKNILSSARNDQPGL